MMSGSITTIASIRDPRTSVANFHNIPSLIHKQHYTVRRAILVDESLLFCPRKNSVRLALKVALYMTGLDDGVHKSSTLMPRILCVV